MTTPDFWPQAVRELSRMDKTMGGIIRQYKGEFMTSRGDAFYTLARSIAGQQISVKAADTIWGRFSAHVGTVTPESVLKAREEDLRACGLSGSKIRYLTGMAEHFEANKKYISAWPELSDEELIAALTAIKGVGRWTAEMMLIFHYLRPDVLPVDDIGLIKGASRHYNDGERMGKQAVKELGERWRPWRSVATWYLWRSQDPVPVEY